MNLIAVNNKSNANGNKLVVEMRWTYNYSLNAKYLTVMMRCFDDEGR